MIEREQPEPILVGTVNDLQDHLTKNAVDGLLELDNGKSVSIFEVAYYWNEFVGNENRPVQDFVRPYETIVPSWLNKQRLIEDGEADGKLIIPKYLRPDFERLLIAELDKPLDERRRLTLADDDL